MNQPERGAGPQPVDSRLDALDAAAVGLLEPLIAAMSFDTAASDGVSDALRGDADAAGTDPSAAEAPRLWRSALGQALEKLSLAAAPLELAGLVQTADLLAGHLARAAARSADAAARDPMDEILLDRDAALELALAEGWVSDAIAFCSGQLTSDDSANLVGRLRDWPGLGQQLSAERASALAVRLRADAQRIAQATRSSLQPVQAQPVEEAPAPAPVEEAPPPPQAPAPDEEPERASTDLPSGRTQTAPTVGADELQMLAEAARQLDEEFDEALADDTGPASFPLLADVIRRYARALAHVGLDDVSRALSGWQRNIDLVAARAATFTADQRELLAALAVRWEEAFAKPSAQSARRALAVLTDTRWPQPLEESLSLAAQRMLSSMHVVGTRRVEATPAPLDDGAWSLAIPHDADSSVVDQLLRELPVLSAAFSLAIERVRDGSRGELAEAQRIAHTLKGAANTVGIRGIATLTHRLEGLLQLIGSGSGGDCGTDCAAGLAPGLGETLVRAADCLADMSDAVVEREEPPPQLPDVHRAIEDWIARLSSVDMNRAAEAASAGEADGHIDEGGDRDADGHVPESGGGLPAGHRAAREDWLRVPASLIERLLDVTGEASILLAQSQEQAAEVDRVRSLLVGATDQLLDLSSEVERLVDMRGSMLGERRVRDDFDPLELDEHNDLQMVSRRIAESGADGRLIERQLGTSLGTLRDLLSRLERLQVDLRETALQTRTTTFGTAVPRWMRTVRQSARMARREVALRVDGEDLGVDAPLLQELMAPIGHLLRNAVDHGIEDPLLRESIGKPRQGRIDLHFAREGRDLLVTCADDGAGLDFPAIRAQAVTMGLIDRTRAATNEELARFVLLPEFSTRDQVTQLSGRGIGLDVVAQALHGLRGTVALQSRAGQGTRVVLRLPVRVSTVPVVIIRSATHVIGLSVRGVAHIAGDRATDGPALARIVRLEDILGLPEDAFADAGGAGTPGRVLFEVCMSDDSRIGVRVPEPGQPRNIVVRPLPTFLPPISGFEGAAVLGDGAVAPVYDLPRLLAGRAGGRARPALRARQPVCLVVDDSVSVRGMTEQFVRDLGFDVASAGDGIEALECIHRQMPSIVLVDLEMPRMNGIDFVRTLRARAVTERIPVVMITSRSSDRHRAAALEAGVDVFLTKPYTEDVLAAHIIELLQGRAGSSAAG